MLSDNDYGSEGSDVEDDSEGEELVAEVDFDDHVAAYKPVKLDRRKSFDVLDKAELLADQKTLIREIMDVLGVQSTAIATTLLRATK